MSKFYDVSQDNHVEFHAPTAVSSDLKVAVSVQSYLSNKRHEPHRSWLRPRHPEKGIVRLRMQRRFILRRPTLPAVVGEFAGCTCRPRAFFESGPRTELFHQRRVHRSYVRHHELR